MAALHVTSVVLCGLVNQLSRKLKTQFLRESNTSLNCNTDKNKESWVCNTKFQLNGAQPPSLTLITCTDCRAACYSSRCQFNCWHRIDQLKRRSPVSTRFTCTDSRVEANHLGHPSAQRKPVHPWFGLLSAIALWACSQDSLGLTYTKGRLHRSTFSALNHWPPFSQALMAELKVITWDWDWFDHWKRISQVCKIINSDGFRITKTRLPRWWASEGGIFQGTQFTCAMCKNSQGFAFDSMTECRFTLLHTAPHYFAWNEVFESARKGPNTKTLPNVLKAGKPCKAMQP